jgi:hypothetical protein
MMKGNAVEKNRELEISESLCLATQEIVMFSRYSITFNRMLCSP